MAYRGVPSRFYRGQPCCDGKQPYWWDVWPAGRTPTGHPQDIGGPLSPDEEAAARAINLYGSEIIKTGSPVPVMVPLARTNLSEWNTNPSFMGSGDVYGPYDRNVRRLVTCADLPSLPPHRYPQTGLPDPVGFKLHEERERARRVTSIRPVWDEELGRHRAMILWCSYCGPDVWEQFVQDLSSTFDEIVAPLIRGIAMICSYIPVVGTAVSFVLNAATSLIQGESVDSAFFDAFAGALPGQPMAGQAFNAIRGLVRGLPFDQIAIESLPIPREAKTALTSIASVIKDIAEGQSISDIALARIRERLPPAAQKAMDVAQRVANGENPVGLVMNEAETMAATEARRSEEGVRRYVAEAGYQAALDMLSPELKDAVTAGLAAGAIEKKEEQYIGTFSQAAESNTAVNNDYEAKGRALVEAGIRWRGMLVKDILKGNTFTITVEDYDAMNKVWYPKEKTYTITDAWRRGFLIAIGVCEGMSVKGPGQTAIYQTMAEAGGRDGFDAGQALQYERTRQDQAIFATAAKTKLPNYFAEKAAFEAAQTAHLIRQAVPAILTEEGHAAAAEKKAAERATWVSYYRRLLIAPPIPAGGMTG